MQIIEEEKKKKKKKKGKKKEKVAKTNGTAVAVQSKSAQRVASLVDQLSRGESKAPWASVPYNKEAIVYGQADEELGEDTFYLNLASVRHEVTSWPVNPDGTFVKGAKPLGSAKSYIFAPNSTGFANADNLPSGSIRESFSFVIKTQKGDEYIFTCRNGSAVRSWKRFLKTLISELPDGWLDGEGDSWVSVVPKITIKPDSYESKFGSDIYYPEFSLEEVLDSEEFTDQFEDGFETPLDDSSDSMPF